MATPLSASVPSQYWLAGAYDKCGASGLLKVWRSDGPRTGELNDLTGVSDGLRALKRSKVLEGGTLRVYIRAARRDIEVVEYPALFDQELGNLERQLS